MQFIHNYLENTGNCKRQHKKSTFLIHLFINSQFPNSQFKTKKLKHYIIHFLFNMPFIDDRLFIMSYDIWTPLTLAHLSPLYSESVSVYPSLYLMVWVKGSSITHTHTLIPSAGWWFNIVFIHSIFWQTDCDSKKMTVIIDKSS